MSQSAAREAEVGFSRVRSSTGQRAAMTPRQTDGQRHRGQPPRPPSRNARQPSPHIPAGPDSAVIDIAESRTVAKSGSPFTCGSCGRTCLLDRTQSDVDIDAEADLGDCCVCLGRRTAACALCFDICSNR
mmetsp:Transcript_11028/g.23387  ORF Transcript_11028/g.23387 Transcript_11028/m.23387 type:complete len:130 (-) Transcript_11028:577-966(-)